MRGLPIGLGRVRNPTVQRSSLARDRNNRTCRNTSKQYSENRFDPPARMAGPDRHRPRTTPRPPVADRRRRVLWSRTAGPEPSDAPGRAGYGPGLPPSRRERGRPTGEVCIVTETPRGIRPRRLGLAMIAGGLSIIGDDPVRPRRAGRVRQEARPGVRLVAGRQRLDAGGDVSPSSSSPRRSGRGSPGPMTCASTSPRASPIPTRCSCSSPAATTATRGPADDHKTGFAPGPGLRRPGRRAAARCPTSRSWTARPRTS